MGDDCVDEISGLTVHCPIVFGSTAFWLGRKADESATHRWTLYVRGPRGEDLSYFISKVSFHLHESFAQPVRDVLQPPFEVTESGWGEFEARIQIHFHDETEQPLEVIHPIKLYPAANTPPSLKKPVVHEVYDEVVFTNPSEDFYEKMNAGASRRLPEHSMKEHWPSFSDANELHVLMNAHRFISEELDRAKSEISRLESEREGLKTKISEKAGSKKTAPK